MSSFNIVKPLTWHMSTSNETGYAETILGTYAIWVIGDDPSSINGGRIAYVCGPDAEHGTVCGTTLEDAKLGAMALYTARLSLAFE